MDEKAYEKEDTRDFKVGMTHFSLFVFFIFAGIFVKRVLGHPEFMMMFHGPAAVFLAVAGMRLTRKQRRRFKEVRID